MDPPLAGVCLEPKDSCCPATRAVPDNASRSEVEWFRSLKETRKIQVVNCNSLKPRPYPECHQQRASVLQQRESTTSPAFVRGVSLLLPLRGAYDHVFRTSWRLS